MTAEEQIAQLKEELAAQRAQNAMLQAKLEAQRAENRSLQAENTALRADNAQLREQMEHMLVRLVELEGRLAKDSHNSSKPPSSDGLARKPHSQRQPSGKKSGGQPGHAGHSLQMVEQPDTIISHRPRECGHCHQPLEGVAGQVVERRQVQDLPVWRVEVKEHQVEEVVCPSWKPGEPRDVSGRGERTSAVWAGGTSAGGVPAPVPVGADAAHLRGAQ